MSFIYLATRCINSSPLANIRSGFSASCLPNVRLCTMQAVEYHSNADIRIVELPIPEIGQGELLVQLRACGLCASDVMEWYMQPRAPLYPGHEPVGVVSAGGE